MRKILTCLCLLAFWGGCDAYVRRDLHIGDDAFIGDDAQVWGDLTVGGQINAPDEGDVDINGVTIDSEGNVRTPGQVIADGGVISGEPIQVVVDEGEDPVVIIDELPQPPPDDGGSEPLSLSVTSFAVDKEEVFPGETFRLEVKASGGELSHTLACLLPDAVLFDTGEDFDLVGPFSDEELAAYEESPDVWTMATSVTDTTTDFWLWVDVFEGVTPTTFVTNNLPVYCKASDAAGTMTPLITVFITVKGSAQTMAKLKFVSPETADRWLTASLEVSR